MFHDKLQQVMLVLVLVLLGLMSFVSSPSLKA